MWLFLDLLAGESLVVLMASLFPNFVVALALTAFANGLWMSVGGFLVSPKILNPFWRYVFHYIDYVSPLSFTPSPPSSQLIHPPTSPANLRLPRHDGQRIRLPHLLLRPSPMHLHVPDRPSVPMRNRR